MDRNNLDIIRGWQGQGLKIVLVTGVFDLLHIEHIRFLTKAKDAGSKLVVGIESDERVKQIKGYERPVNQERVRKEQLESLRPVDLVFILPKKFSHQQDWESLMNLVKPDIYAVSNHTSFLDSKQKICEKYGINFQIVHRFNPDYSSTKILQKLQEDLG